MHARQAYVGDLWRTGWEMVISAAEHHFSMTSCSWSALRPIPLRVSGRLGVRMVTEPLPVCHLLRIISPQFDLQKLGMQEWQQSHNVVLDLEAYNCWVNGAPTPRQIFLKGYQRSPTCKGLTCRNNTAARFIRKREVWHLTLTFCYNKFDQMKNKMNMSQSWICLHFYTAAQVFPFVLYGHTFEHLSVSQFPKETFSINTFSF